MASGLDIIQNHLIETASPGTGSILIWDTGEYSILPWKEYVPPKDSNSDISDAEDSENSPSIITESQKLHNAFQQKRIRVRLHGTRLPPQYTISLRLLASNDRTEQPVKPKRRRKKHDHHLKTRHALHSSSSEDDPSNSLAEPKDPTDSTGQKIGDDQTPEAEMIRLANAYPGTTNTVSSIHQRRWFLTLDRHNSGYVRNSDERGRKWIRKDGHEPSYFHVLGRDVERSVVTGRSAAEVLADEGVVGFVPRAFWKGITE